jgi:hypothetical protein
MRRSTFLLPLLLLAFHSAAQSGAQFHWPLDEVAGPVANDVAGGTSGVLQGSVLWDPDGGHHQGAARFDGVDDRILLGPCDMTTGGTGFSISVWVKPDFVTAQERTIIAKTSGPAASDHIWSLAFVNATALRFRLRAGGSTTELSSPPSTLFSGTWYHLVASYDGAVMRIHVNGALMASTAKTGSLGFFPQSPASLAAQSTGTFAFSGWVDDVRIYDRGLTDAEIITLLFETLTTEVVEHERAHVDAAGMLRLPQGDWERMRVMDLGGRILLDERTSGRNTMHTGTLTAGMFLVCLEGPGVQRVSPVFVP